MTDLQRVTQIKMYDLPEALFVYAYNTIYPGQETILINYNAWTDPASEFALRKEELANAKKGRL